MNVVYNAALRQSKAIRADLDRVYSNTNEPNGGPPAPTPSEIGNVAASLASFSKTVEEYSVRVREEPVLGKQKDAQVRLAKFRDDLSTFRSDVEGLKRAREDATMRSDRAELFGRRPFAASSPEKAYASSSTATGGSRDLGSGYGVNTGGGAAGGVQMMGGFGSANEQRETHALREQNFLASTHTALDDYIMRGQAVLGNLSEQREMLKGTQRRLYTVANTLGISGDTIRMVERRAREDKWIFGAGAIAFFIFCWLCLRYLR